MNQQELYNQIARENLLRQAKPILFNTEMVRAILEGRKTQTRRVVPERVLDAYYDYDDWCNSVIPSDIPCKREYEAEFFMKRARYKKGDILYVRETFAQMKCSQCDIEWGECETNIYRSIPPLLSPNCDDGVYVYRATDSVNAISNGSVKWRPSIHMPKEAARIFLQVTDIRVERLQECGKGWCIDIEKEGVVTPLDPILYIDDEEYHSTLREQFRKLWDSTIKTADRDKYGWEANPYVWVISFTRLEVEDDA